MRLEGIQLGHYRLLRFLQGGGMGEVYLAEDLKLTRQVAIKVMKTEPSLYPGTQASKDASRFFQREMRAISMLDHPHILTLHEAGEEHVGHDTIAYMVMPYCPEGSLADWIRRYCPSQPLSPQGVSQLLTQAAEALQYAHDQHILHLDIKPQNFLVRRQQDPVTLPNLLLADFGVAKMANTTKMSGTARGTLDYMAPEQLANAPVAASDQYALAIMIYELLTGRTPFQGVLPQVLPHMHAHVDPQPPSQINPAVPAVLDAVVLCALAKKPADRFTSVKEFASTFGSGLNPNNPSLQEATLSSSENIPAQVPSLRGTPFTIGEPPNRSPQQPLLTPEPSQSSPFSHQDVAPQPKRRVPLAVTVFLILLILILLGGVSFGIYRSVTGIHSDLYGVAWSGSQFVAVGSAILTSPDGRTWTAQNAGSASSLDGIAWSGSQFVAVGDHGTILTSPDGRTWTAQNAGSAGILNSVTWSGSQFVAVGDRDTILTSPDGRIWTAQNAGSGSSLLDGIAWSGSQFVAVGVDTILTSPDGRTWTAQNAGILNSVTWSGSQFVAVGVDTILTSPDGRTWTAQNAGNTGILNSVTWSGSQFVAVGDHGTILTSPDGRTWTT